MLDYISEVDINDNGFYCRVANPNDITNLILIHVTPELLINAYIYRLHGGTTETAHRMLTPCVNVDEDYLVPLVPNMYEYKQSQFSVSIAACQHMVKKDDYLYIECHLEHDMYHSQNVQQWFMFYPPTGQARMTHVTRINELITNKTANSFTLTHPEQRGTSMVMSFEIDEDNNLSTSYTLHHGVTAYEPEPVQEEYFEELKNTLVQPFQPVVRSFFARGYIIKWNVSLYRTQNDEWGIGSEIEVQDPGYDDVVTTKQYVLFPKVAPEPTIIEPHRWNRAHGVVPISVRSPFVFPARRRGGN